MVVKGFQKNTEAGKMQKMNAGRELFLVTASAKEATVFAMACVFAMKVDNNNNNSLISS
jgi:hypothetical protein